MITLSCQTRLTDPTDGITYIVQEVDEPCDEVVVMSGHDAGAYLEVWPLGRVLDFIRVDRFMVSQPLPGFAALLAGENAGGR